MPVFTSPNSDGLAEPLDLTEFQETWSAAARAAAAANRRRRKSGGTGEEAKRSGAAAFKKAGGERSGYKQAEHELRKSGYTPQAARAKVQRMRAMNIHHSQILRTAKGLKRNKAALKKSLGKGYGYTIGDQTFRHGS